MKRSNSFLVHVSFLIAFQLIDIILAQITQTHPSTFLPEVMFQTSVLRKSGLVEQACNTFFYYHNWKTPHAAFRLQY